MAADLQPERATANLQSDFVPGRGRILSEGQRNDSLFRRACALRRKGFSQEQIERALDILNSRHCQPPLDAKEIQKISASAARYQAGGADYLQAAWGKVKELRMSTLLKAGVLYFALVFGAGFVLGTIRTLWVVPRIGARRAELMEMPIMLVVTIVAARWTVLRLSVPIMWSARLEMGCVALVLMLIAEFGFVLWVRGISIKNYLATRDAVSGTVYYLMLVLFAIMPLLVDRG